MRSMGHEPVWRERLTMRRVSAAGVGGDGGRAVAVDRVDRVVRAGGVDSRSDMVAGACYGAVSN